MKRKTKERKNISKSNKIEWWKRVHVTNFD